MHQIRVAITWLRSAVAFFAPITVDAEWLRLKKEIAWPNVSLGAARDTDVVMGYAGRKRYRQWTQGLIGQNLDERRKRDHRRLVRCLRSRRFRRLIEDLSGWIGRGAWFLAWEDAARREPAAPLAAYSARRLDRWHKRLIRQGRHLATMDAPRRHRLRIKAKRLRYMLEALANIVPVYDPAEIRHMHKAAKDLQRALGDLRDLRRFGRLAPGRGRWKAASKAVFGRQAIDGKRKSCWRPRSRPTEASSRRTRADAAIDGRAVGVRDPRHLIWIR